VKPLRVKGMKEGVQSEHSNEVDTAILQVMHKQSVKETNNNLRNLPGAHI